jgi:protoporphyrinogen/coproporphyrinogen III oxidase
MAGLAAGLRLVESGWQVLVLEKEEQVGGRCRTVESGGFLLDTGTQFFRDSYDSTLKAAINLELGERFRMPPWGKGVVSAGEVCGFTPRSTNPLKLLPWKAMVPARAPGVLPAAAALVRGYRGYNIRFPGWWSKGDDLTADAYLARRTSTAFRERIASPVAIYAMGASLEEISGSAFMAATRMTFMDRTVALSTGIGTLARAIAGRLEVKTGMEATRVNLRGRAAAGVRARPTGGGRARSYRADAVVCAVPACEVKGLTAVLGRAARAAVRSTVYSPAAVVNLGYSGRLEGPAGPVLLPGSEGFEAGWICADGSKAPDYVPDGSSLATVVYAGSRAERLIDLEPEAILEEAASEVERVLSVGKAEVTEYRIDRHAAGYPVVSPGHASRVKALEAAGSGVRNMSLAGDWTSSPTVEGAVTSGIRAADALL